MNGVMLAARMQKKKSVGMVYIGDGGTSTGAFHEAANFAAPLGVEEADLDLRRIR